MYLKHGKAAINASHHDEDDNDNNNNPDGQRAHGWEVGRLVLRSHSVAVLGAHLLGAIVLNEGIEWYHTVDFQQHWRGAQLLLAWSAAKVAGGWAAAFLLAADLHT